MSDGPAHNTRAAAHNACCNWAHKNTTPHKKYQTPEQGDVPARPDSATTCEESILTSLMNSLSDDQPEGSTSPEGSKHGTICEDIYEQEQLYTTAPGSLGPSVELAGYQVPSPEDTGHTPSSSSHDEERMVTTPLALAEEEWMQVNKQLTHWSYLAEKNKADAMNYRQEVNDLQLKVTETCQELKTKVTNMYHSSNKVSDAMQGMHHLLDRVCTWYKGQTVPSLSPCAQATWAIFADQGSDEGTVDFKHQTNAWAHFENSWPIKQSMEEPGPPPGIRDRAPHMERYDRQMAESHTRAAYRSLWAWTSGPPTQVQNKPEETLDFRNNEGAEENQQNPGSMEPQGLSQHNHTLSPASLIRPMYIMLDQDYACCSMSARSQQMVGLIAISGSTQRRSVAMTVPTIPIQGQAGQNATSIVSAMTIPGESDHKITMIDALRNHIRDLLMGIPNNLPEIKGLWAKLPEAYDGEDNFDCLDRWLQGLLIFFKIHCLTGADKDIDWVLVTGTCLKGKAER